MTTQIEISHFTYERTLGSGNRHACVKIKAGKREVEHIVPPAGEDSAFDVQRWAREVEVYVSPTGRSVRVYVDGEEVR